MLRGSGTNDMECSLARVISSWSASIRSVNKSIIVSDSAVQVAREDGSAQVDLYRYAGVYTKRPV